MRTVPATGRRQGTSRRVFIRLALAVVATVAWVVPYAPPAHALPVPQAAPCAGVWVVVDFGGLAATQIGCATSYGTGTQALRSAAFTPSFDSGGLMAKINGLPTVPNTQQNYWSYWFATRQADGSYSKWVYYAQGPNGSTPSSGNAEGWRYESTSGGEVPPGVYPPKQVAATQPPATTAPATRTTTAARTTTTTVAAQVTTQPAATAAASTDSATPSVTPDPTDSPSSTPGASDPPSREPISAVGQASSSTGGLIGGVSSIAAIAAGATGMLLWRKRQARAV